MQVIYAATHRLRSWDNLQRSDMQGIAAVVSQQLEQVAKFFFCQAFGWRSSLRIDCH